jgi:hypothetical protein
MGCNYTYKDADGNPSAIYQRALEKYGPEKAEELYIRHMMSTVDTRSSKSTTDVTWEERAKEVETNADHTAYENKASGKTYGTVTNLLQTYIRDDSSSSLVAQMTGISKLQGLELGEYNQAIELLDSALTAAQLPLEKRKLSDLKAFAEANPDIFEKAKADVRSLWKAQQEEGTILHAILAEISKVAEEESERTGMPVDPKNIYHIIQKAKENLEGSGIWYRDGDKYKGEKFSTPALADALSPLYTYINKKSRELSTNAKKPVRLILKPELKVFTDTLRDPNSNFDGIAGTIDLIAMTEDKSTVILIDFKTKAKHKAIDFDKTYNQKIMGPFETPSMSYSSANMATAQELIYATILKNDPNYRLNVTELVSVIIPMTFGTKAQDDLGNNEYHATSVGKAELRGPEEVGTRTDMVQAYYTETGKGGLRQIYDEARETGIAGVTENWSGKTADGTPMATYSKWHREPFIEGRLISKRIDPDGKSYVYSFNGEKIDVTGLSDDKFRKLLGAKYDEAKLEQTNIANDVITIFNSPDGKMPKTLLNKTQALGVLLRGINKTTHRLELAQNFMPELRGIGPDVLLAVNKRTGAVTLLSAVITKNSEINFQSDDSGETRTSLVGNFASDKSLRSGMLSDNLMYKPVAHDFLSMKLGLAALHLKNYYGDKLKVEKMMVVSMLNGASIPYTTTTIDMEVAKLEAFKEHAGTDFPQEYSDLLKNQEIKSTGDHVKDLMMHIANNTDPLGGEFRNEAKRDLFDRYNEYQVDKLQGWELKKALGNYLQAVARKLGSHARSDEELQNDPRFILASKALLEFSRFDMNMQEYASERNSIAAINGAVSSGDKMMMRFHVEYNSASSRTRTDMNNFFKQHKKLADAIRKEKSADWLGDTEKAFGNLYKKGVDQSELMTFKDVSDSTLSANEKAYITFFNDEMAKVMMLISPREKLDGIESGRFWKKGTVPIMFSRPELLTMKSFASWSSLKKAVDDKIKSAQKKTMGKTLKSFLEFEFPTQFDDQATDEGVGFSEKRRKVLGLLDPNSPTDPKMDNVERNPFAILNVARLEAAEKINNKILLQTIVAAQTMLASSGDRKRVGMTSEMLDMWKEMLLFSRYKEEPIGKIVDPLNRLSSEVLFSYSIRQAMIELSTGTLQTASALMANTMQNAYAQWFDRPEMAGRYTWSDFSWGLNAWAKWDPKINQMVYDNGMLVADADDLRTAEFYGADKVRIFKSEAAFFANRVFFNSAITHTFLAQMRHKGIDKAYRKEGEQWVYDETLDPRFFAYDPDNNIGTVAPETDDEKKRYSIWKAARETMAEEGNINPVTKMMYVPFTGNERAEIKLYATRMVGSFSKDNQIHGEAYALMRTMARYKKWAFQKIANYYTPTVKGEPMYGHWETQLQPDGNYKTIWVGDDFQGILQTVGFMVKEIASLRGISMAKNLNKYQLENLTKLLADIVLWILMMALMLPLLADVEDEVNETTGKIKSVTGAFGKSQLGTSAYRALTNAAADLLFVTSLPGLSQSMAPGLSVVGTGIKNAAMGIADIIQGPGEGEGFLKGMERQTTIGGVRSILSLKDIITGFE